MRKMRKILYLITIIVILAFFVAPQNLYPIGNEEFYILPKESQNALNSLYKKIDASKRNIKISIYTFTHKGIAKQLKKAARRGVKVEIIFDTKQNQHDKFSMLRYLAKYRNITVYTLSGFPKKHHKKGIMHIKAATIDDKVAIFGSANWTYSAFRKNFEILYITQNYAIAKKFNKAFERLKQKAKLYQ